MQIGIDSFAGSPAFHNPAANISNAQAMAQLIKRMEYADKCGLSVFGIGEHYREEFLDSAPNMILAAAAARTQQIRLTSAVTVLSANDPVRVFQNFATLDLISNGRAEIVAGRGSFTESFPLFGLNLQDYDKLFAEKLGLLLELNENEFINWSGQFRPALDNQAIYPRPVQEKLPVWIGVGGTPGSFVRAGMLGVPIMVAVIGGETRRFGKLVDAYRQAGAEAGHPPEKLKVGLHSLGFVDETTEDAHESYYPGYAKIFNSVGKERGWPPVTRQGFNAQAGHFGAIVIGNPREVAEKIVRHSEALGGISRFTFQMDNALLTHEQLMESIRLIGEEVIPMVNQILEGKG